MKSKSLEAINKVVIEEVKKVLLAKSYVDIADVFPQQMYSFES